MDAAGAAVIIPPKIATATCVACHCARTVASLPRMWTDLLVLPASVHAGCVMRPPERSARSAEQECATSVLMLVAAKLDALAVWGSG